MIFLLLACSVEEPEPPEPAPVEGSAPGREMAFEYRPEGVELVPSLVELHAAMTAAGLQEAAVVRARAVEHKPDVVVANIAAVRTGAEIGAFAIEVGVADPDLVAERMARIQTGLDAIKVDGPASAAAQDMEAFLRTGPLPEEVLARLDNGRMHALDLVEDHGGEEIIPLMAAGAWLQAYALLAGAMEDTERYEAGHALFHKPPIGDYFATYAATVGGDVIPSGVLEPLEMNLQLMKTYTASDPMSPEQVRAMREACEGLLGML